VEDIKLKATAKVKITKIDDKGNVIEIEERTVALTEEEAKKLWLSQQQD
jgi:hypothetical protein